MLCKQFIAARLMVSHCSNNRGDEIAARKTFRLPSSGRRDYCQRTCHHHNFRLPSGANSTDDEFKCYFPPAPSHQFESSHIKMAARKSMRHTI